MEDGRIWVMFKNDVPRPADGWTVRGEGAEVLGVTSGPDSASPGRDKASRCRAVGTGL